MIRFFSLAGALLAATLTGCNAHDAASLMPAKLIGAMTFGQAATTTESMRIFSCTQVGFSAAACAGGATTVKDLSNWEKFSNLQGQSGYHYYQIQDFNVGGTATPYWIYEKP